MLASVFLPVTLLLSTSPAVIALKPSSSTSWRVSDLERGRQQSGSATVLPRKATIDLDAALEVVTSETYGKPVISKFAMTASSIYHRWHSTVLELTWSSVAFNVGIAFAFVVFMQFGSLGVSFPFLGQLPAASWPLFTAPDALHPLVMRLNPLYVMWGHHVTLTTLVLTFFLTEAFTYWKRTLENARLVQRCLVDIAMLLSAHAARDDASGRITQEARQLLVQTTADLSLFQTLFWASIDRRLSALRTAAGLRKLHERGIVSRAQLTAFESCETSKAKALAIEEEARLDDNDGEVSVARGGHSITSLCASSLTCYWLQALTACRLPLLLSRSHRRQLASTSAPALSRRPISRRPIRLPLCSHGALSAFLLQVEIGSHYAPALGSSRLVLQWIGARLMRASSKPSSSARCEEIELSPTLRSIVVSRCYD